MGRASRRRPARLAEKLREIRMQLDLSQDEMSDRLSDDTYPVYKADISNFESGKREPNLIILLQFAKMVNTTVDALIDDEKELPEIP